MNKRLVWKSALLLGIAVFMVTLLVACGGGSPTTPAKPTTPAPTTPAPTTPAPATPTAGTPQNLPATHAGRTAGCTACHETGVAGAPKFPANHAGRTDATCTTCHKSA